MVDYLVTVLLLQVVSSSFFSFSEEEKRSKKEELSFLTPEISSFAKLDKGVVLRTYDLLKKVNQNFQLTGCILSFSVCRNFYWLGES